MRTLMLSWEYPPHMVGGLGNHVANLLPALGRRDTHLTLLTPGFQGGAACEQLTPTIGVRRIAVAAQTSASIPDYARHVNTALLPAAREFAAQEGPFDLVHNHDWMTAESAVSLARLLNVPLVTTIHATERGRWRGTLFSEQSHQIDRQERWLVTHSDRLIVCSQAMIDEVTSAFAADRAHLDVVPNATVRQPNPFANAAEQRAFRRRYAADEAHLGFTIGRVVYEKGIHVLLDAWAQVSGQAAAQLVVAGAGPELEAARAHVAALGLQQRVLFTGRISDDERNRLYHCADVAVFPSLYEPFGIVALEAQAAGCPVVVSATGGLREIVRPHETGILVEPGNAASLAWGLLHTLNHPHWAQARTRNALHDLDTIYSWPAVAGRTLATYRQAVAAHCVPLPMQAA